MAVSSETKPWLPPKDLQPTPMLQYEYAHTHARIQTQDKDRNNLDYSAKKLGLLLDDPSYTHAKKSDVCQSGASLNRFNSDIVKTVMGYDLSKPKKVAAWTVDSPKVKWSAEERNVPQNFTCGITFIISLLSYMGNSRLLYGSLGQNPYLHSQCSRWCSRSLV
ncbi:hypothetical protein RUM44_010582 [Polyplax serrata]|uniref:Uncharacterized protein n=1 Tax=Polyplax serrata TaxID=468196 RepID=A0ABR1AW06_POLSC